LTDYEEYARLIVNGCNSRGTDPFDGRKVDKGGNAMADPKKVVLKIVSVKGTCAAGHKVGEEFDLSKDFILGFSGEGRALCPSAFYAAFPSWRVLRFGGEFPWEEDKDTAHVACPDPLNPLMMELRRIRE